MKDILGYLLAAIGIAGIMMPIFDPENIYAPFLKQIPSTPLLIVSLVVLAVGIFILVKKGKNKKGKVSIAREVPIYEGGKVVGFRKVKTV